MGITTITLLPKVGRELTITDGEGIMELFCGEFHPI
jgi:hypothetical protein